MTQVVLNYLLKVPWHAQAIEFLTKADTYLVEFEVFLMYGVTTTQ